MLKVNQLLRVSPYTISRMCRSVTMKALQFNAKEKKLQLINKEVQCVCENDIKVEVHYAGVCGTDLHIVAGEFPCKEDGLVLGHEITGVVKEIGGNVTHVAVGDKVVADPQTSCMVCKFCRIGQPHFCPNGGLNTTTGIYKDGGWAQYVVVSDTQVHKIPDSITLEQASLCEPMSCLSHTWNCIGPVLLGSRILVLGAGIIGNLFACLLHLQGHRNVIISDPNKQRLKLTEGLDLCYQLVVPDELKCMQKNNPDFFFDYVVDASGNTKAMEEAFEMLNYGGKLCLFGVADPKKYMKINPFNIFLKELSIQGCLINPFSFPTALSILESMGNRYISFKKLGVQTFKLEKYEDALATLRKGGIAKATFMIASQSC